MDSARLDQDQPRKRRWHWILWLVLPVLLATVTGAMLVLSALRSEPAFYQAARTAVQDTAVRRQAADRFEEKRTEFVHSIEQKDAWEHEFTQDEINAWLIEELPATDTVTLPKGISEPLVQLASGVMQLGCRVETKQYRGVLSILLAPQVEEDGDVVLTVQQVKAGEMEVPAKQLLDQVSTSLSKTKLPIEFQRGEDEKIVVDLKQAAPDWQGVQLTSITVTDGKVTFQGRRDS